ncbi:MAG: hypothetical protein QM778_29795 [Myxococcales bacterium]
MLTALRARSVYSSSLASAPAKPDSIDGQGSHVCGGYSQTSCQAHHDFGKQCERQTVLGDAEQDKAALGNDASCGAADHDDGFLPWNAARTQYRCTTSCLPPNSGDCPLAAGTCTGRGFALRVLNNSSAQPRGSVHARF